MLPVSSLCLSRLSSPFSCLVFTLDLINIAESDNKHHCFEFDLCSWRDVLDSNSMSYTGSVDFKHLEVVKGR